MYDHTNDRMKLGTSNADRVTIASDGDVGIGTTTPATKLHVTGNVRLNAGGDVEFGGSNTEIREASSDMFVTADDDLYLSPDDDVYIRADGGSDWVHFDSGNERVGIGIVDPAAALDVYGPSWQNIVQLGNNATNKLRFGSGASWASLSGGGSYTDDLVIEHATGNIGIGTTDPNADLDVEGSVRLTHDGSSPYLLYASRDEGGGEETAWFWNSDDTGTGLYVAGEGQGITYWSAGQGLAVSGYDIGTYVKAQRTGNGNQKAIHATLGTTNYTYICYRTSGGSQYDVYGDGGYGFAMPTSKGERTLVSTASPEPWIEDYGSAEIIDGVGHVDLDPLYLDCVAVKAAHPLKVFIELTSPLVNQYYISKGTTGFDVVVVGEDAKNANATFDYRVVAKRQGRESKRFEEAEMLPDKSQLMHIEPPTEPSAEPVQMRDNQ
jgi:hypothetical protein